MYGGDEVSAIVVDLGSHTCKAGYAGEDAPKAVFPSVVGAIDGNGMDIDDAANTTEDAKESDKEKGKRKLYTGSQALNFRRDQMEILSPTKDGIVTDWDMVDNVWDHAFRASSELTAAERKVWFLYLLSMLSSSWIRNRLFWWNIINAVIERTPRERLGRSKVVYWHR
ncbi:actin-related proteins 4A [Arabidopsis thaliana]|uniref:Actin-related proteins 4A n=1 Tax=Arabidopsis thaliana TaxID=3702 RepID=A0A1P8AVW4_ARATH|nr:actin-related proteins 4A [Arabidopsis thaliana]ANM60798.1 actin-related proteins 4A [Arabidopsis thaliana]|eukprot:NP_001323058.1 actin-related proteins 4A [Arabidopsis thaliana]